MKALSKRHSPAIAAASLIPMVAVAAFAAAGSHKSIDPVELASERATATETSMLCPGPMASALGSAASTSDSEFQAEGPAAKVGYRSISVEPESNLLFGHPEVSETQLNDDGTPKRPKQTVTKRDGTAFDVAVVDGQGDFVTSGTYGITQPFDVVSTSFDQAQPIMDAVQGTMTASGDYRSLALSRCEGVTVDQTFVGVNTKAGNESSLVLFNPSDRAARASITVFTDEGVAESSSASTVVVAPGQTERVNVQALAPEHERIALRVRVDGSALGMHVETSEHDGLTPMGSEYIASQRLGTSLTIPGVQIREGRPVNLTLVNGSGVPTDATVTLMGTDGQPVGEPVTVSDIAGGAVAATDIAGADGTYSLSIESSSPIGATARSTAVSPASGGGDTVAPAQDFASQSPAPAITNSALLAVGNRANGGTLALYADSATTVEVLGVLDGGTLTEPATVDIPARGTGLVSAGSLKTPVDSLVGFVIVPELPGVVHGTWVQATPAEDSGLVISSVAVPNNNVAPTGIDVRGRP